MTDLFAAFDDLDRQMLELVRSHGRMSYTDMARKLDIPEATARYRFQRLEKEEVIQVRAFPNLALLGQPEFIVVFMRVESGAIEAVSEALLKLEEVQFVAAIVGAFNLVVHVLPQGFGRKLRFFNQLMAIEGLLQYETQSVQRVLKNESPYILR